MSSTPITAASPLQLAVIKQQFINSKLVPAVIPEFDPVGTLVLDYNTTVQKLYAQFESFYAL